MTCLKINATKNKIQLSVNFDERLDQKLISSDKSRLKQVLLNLLSNSFKFTFEGKIQISTQWVSLNGKDMIEFKVQDTGIGIKEHDQNKLFKLFGMVKHGSDKGLVKKNINPNGTGIGLTVSKRYIEYLEGKIKLESTYGVGTIVTFYIPHIKSEASILNINRALVPNIEIIDT